MNGELIPEPTLTGMLSSVPTQNNSSNCKELKIADRLVSTMTVIAEGEIVQ
jgi:hypothetical protein